jgi:hypothetical protein
VPLPGEACGFSGSPAALVQSYTDHITAAHGGWPCRRFAGATIADKGNKCRQRLAKVGCTDLSNGLSVLTKPGSHFVVPGYRWQMGHKARH